MALTPRSPRNRRNTSGNSRNTSGNGKSQASTDDSTQLTDPIAALDLSQVAHGLTYPNFDGNAHLTQDLASNTSQIPPTTKEKADEVCDAIAQRRQTLRIYRENIGYNQDVILTSTAHQKFLGSVIDLGTAKVSNATKFVNHQTARTNFTVAQTKYQQAQERLKQEKESLEGITALTPLIKQEWEQRKTLKQNRIEDLKQAIVASRSDIEADVKQLA